MKRIILLILLFSCILIASSCKDQKAVLSPMEKWINSAGLDLEEPTKDLYAKALNENTLVIYSDSTRVMDVKESFEKEYPGLTVDVTDIRSADLIELLKSDFESGDYNADIVICDDGDGSLSQELIPKGILYKYVPYDIAEKIIPRNNGAMLSLMGEIRQLFYNSDVYDTPPIHNWWELTEERFRGKIVIPNPLKSTATLSFVSSIINNPEIMSQSYYNLYQKELITEGDETAGETFWRLLMANDLIIVNSSDEVYELVGAAGQPNPPLGIMVSSKIRMKDLGYPIEPIFEMDSFSGVYSPNNIMIAGGSKNVSCAKLFIRWILGEADGQGIGYKPYLQNGTWSVRSDVHSETTISLDDIQVIQTDSKIIYEQRDTTLEFWCSLLETR